MAIDTSPPSILGFALLFTLITILIFQFQSLLRNLLSGNKNITLTKELLKIIPLCLVTLLLIIAALPKEGHLSKRIRFARQHLKEVAGAIEAYHADHHSWPAMRPIAELGDSHLKLHLKGTGEDSLTALEPGRPLIGLAGITTPVAYLPSIPMDNFASPQGIRPIIYYADQYGWLLTSTGPAGNHAVDPRKDFDGRAPQPAPSLIRMMYDPTNGIVSQGEFMAFGNASTR